MAGLIFFWQGGCVPYYPVNPGFSDAGYAEKDPSLNTGFAPIYNLDVGAFAPLQPVTANAYLEKSGSNVGYSRRLPPPVCKHE